MLHCSIVHSLSRAHSLPYEIGDPHRLALRKPAHHHPVIVANPQRQGCIEYAGVQVRIVYLFVERLFSAQDRRNWIAYYHAVFVDGYALVKAPEDDRRSNALTDEATLSIGSAFIYPPSTFVFRGSRSTQALPPAALFILVLPQIH
jgi:hypothetical protein